MNATIRLDCIVCGCVDMTADDLVLYLHWWDRSVYTFWHCDMEQWRTANERIVAVLKAAEVRIYT